MIPQAPDGKITLDVSAPRPAKVTTPVDTAMLIWEANPRGRTRGIPAVGDLRAGRPAYVNLEQSGLIVITPYLGTFTVCGLTPEQTLP